MATENEVCVKKCWVPGGFCWKNVWHWAFALAVKFLEYHQYKDRIIN